MFAYVTMRKATYLSVYFHDFDMLPGVKLPVASGLRVSALSQWVMSVGNGQFQERCPNDAAVTQAGLSFGGLFHLHCLFAHLSQLGRGDEAPWVGWHGTVPVPESL